MGLMLVVVTVSVASAGVWLWHLGRLHRASLSLEAWLSHRPRVQATSRKKYSNWLRRLPINKEGLATTARFIVIIACVSLSIIGGTVISTELAKAEPGGEFLSTLSILVTSALSVLLVIRLTVTLFQRGDEQRDVWYSPDMAFQVYSPSPPDYSGEAKLPRKVYEGDSQSIFVNLKPKSRIPSVDAGPVHIQDTERGRSIDLHIEQDARSQQFLEIEFLAAGVEVDGERRLRQELASPSLSYHWSCYFPNSGNHALTLILRLVRPSATIELGTIEHRVRVVKLDHLTKRQVWLLAALAGIVSGGLAVAEALHRLGVW
jgi:hypothetical protein